MLTTAQAHDAILGAIPRFGVESVSIDSALGRVICQSVQAERDQPPFDRVMMDGIAISSAEFEQGQRRFTIQSMQAAGDCVQQLVPGNCIEIMTGAALPEGADCVIPVERIAVHDNVAEIESDYSAETGQFIHPRGSDHAKGAKLLNVGTRISPTDIAIITSCGLTEVSVGHMPAIRVISTGNELVAAGEPIAPQQIRLSNGPAIIAMLVQHGYDDCRHDHLVDDPKLLERRLREHLDEADVLILSGGVSMGKADYIPQVLGDLGVCVVFHKISQRPGKPMWFGIGPEDQPVFALPGNPVSTLICCRQYVIPALNAASGGLAKNPEFATLTTDVTFEPRLTCFLPVKLVSNAAGQQLAMPVHTNTSGDFAALTGTAGYVELALDTSRFPTGTAVPLHRWHLF